MADSNVKSSIKIKGEALEDAAQRLRHLLDDLECPVCLEMFTAPVYLCLTGHDVCGTCRAEVDACPLCKAPITEQRNFSVEHVIATCSTKPEPKANGRRYIDKLKKVQAHTVAELEKLLPHDDSEYQELKSKFESVSEELDKCREELHQKCSDLAEVEAQKEALSEQMAKLELEHAQTCERQEAEKKKLADKLDYIKLNAMEILFGEDEPHGDISSNHEGAVEEVTIEII